MPATLNLVVPNKSIPTIEIDLDSIPSGDDHRIYAADVLRTIAEKYPARSITIYSYSCTSFNFSGRQTDSVFYGFAGVTAAILEKINKSFAQYPGLIHRLSDHIPPKTEYADLHVQEGKLYALTFYGTWALA